MSARAGAVIARTTQDRLRELTGASLGAYRAQVARELASRDRVAAVYGSSFASGTNVEQAATVSQMAATMLDCPHSQVTLLTDTQQVSVVRWNAPRATTDVEPIDATEGYCQNMLATGEPLVIDNARDHPLVCDTRFARHGIVISYLGVPILGVRGHVIGVLCVWDVRERQWLTADVETLVRLASVLTRAELAYAAAGGARMGSAR